MTGWARGLCARLRGTPAATAGSGQGMAWRRGGGGRGRGFGGGFGRGAGGYVEANAVAGATPPANLDAATPQERRTLLKAERNRLKAQLHEVEESLRETGRGAADESDT
jgi:hypothetical protein